MKKIIILFLIAISFHLASVYGGEKGTISGDDVRLRKEPGGEIITKLHKNTIVSVDAKTEITDTIDGKTASWYKVTLDKQNGFVSGWVFGAYLKLASEKYIESVNDASSAMEVWQACAAASAPEQYGEFTEALPKEFKNTVSEYKEQWRRFCSSKAKSATAISSLENSLETILGKFAEVDNDVTSRMWDHKPSEEELQWSYRFNDLTCDHFPNFIPVFKCLVRADGPWQYKEPSMEAFARIAQIYGTDEDKLFYVEYRDLIGDPATREAPWRQYYEAGAVFMGCLEFKEFDWIEAFKKISKLKKTLKNQDYLAKVLDVEKRMLGELEIPTSGSLCACGSQEEVVATYKQLSHFFAGSQDYKSYATKMDAIVKAIEGGGITVTNDEKQHCGGG